MDTSVPATGGIKFSSVAVGQPRTTIEVAHIIPHHLKKNDNVTRRVAAAFQLFGGIATNIQNDIDQQCNGIPMDICLHRSFDRLEWSIEVLAGVYYLRFVRYPTASPAIGVASQVVQRNMTLTFGGNNNEKPKAELCNVHHAICRFVHMVGMADIFDEIEDDDDEYVPSLKLVIAEDGTEMELEDEDEEVVNKVEIGDDGDIPYVKPSVSTSGNDRNVRFLKEGYPRETVLVN
ncbi:hypothetical protein QCA50_016581 [Cerrena zonata]|uniref:HNH nuclease domain-containing protein n=1 Tax=Cerrena zonata TaxID=2478898 RepID=A0AAW0FSJ6_9APHY